MVNLEWLTTNTSDNSHRIDRNNKISSIEDEIHSKPDDALIRQKNELIQENNELAESRDAQLAHKNRLETKIRELEARKEQLGDDQQAIEERMPLRERVKRVFKKYGFTVASVLTAVGIVVGVIVSQLKSGLTGVAKGVGNGLKTLGKKLGEILPGMVGAIASFIFRTAGEVVGFLAKNAWLLIVAVVVYFIEKLRFSDKKIKK